VVPSPENSRLMDGAGTIIRLLSGAVSLVAALLTRIKRTPTQRGK
jgi:hypothetical protein